jgi:activating signal cointegrator complex subunit 1
VTPKSRPQLQASLQQFSADVLTSDSDGQDIIPEKAIRPLDTLHLTLGVMSLREPEKLERALKHLEDIDLQDLMQSASMTKLEQNASPLRAPIEMAPLTISLESVVSMHPPRSTSILYSTPVDTTNRLGSFCQLLRDSFQKEGLVEDDGRPLLLHATILNTSYASERRANNRRTRGNSKRSSGGGRGPSAEKITFDATEIISRYERFVFVKDMRVENVAICRMGAKMVVDEETCSATEKYEVVREVSLPR